MQLKLRVIGGKSDGREIDINVPEFVIGRGEGVNLRPKSDLISRRHCALGVKDGRAVLTDFGSRNGSYVNGERVDGEIQLKPGDRLRVGRLQFEIVLDHGVGGNKKPRVAGVGDVGERTAASAEENVIEESITDWLTQADDDEKTARQLITETKQFRLDETDQVSQVEDLSKDETMAGSEADTELKPDAKDESEAGEKEKKSGLFSNKKKKLGKLPDKPRFSAADSKDAASDMLKKFFNRR